MIFVSSWNKQKLLLKIVVQRTHSPLYHRSSCTWPWQYSLINYFAPDREKKSISVDHLNVNVEQNSRMNKIWQLMIVVDANIAISPIQARQLWLSIPGRYHSRFFVRVGHETTDVFSGNHHFSLCHVIVRPTKIILQC